jgi:hypothetical protein
MSAKPASYWSASSDNDISAKRSSQNVASDAEDYKPSAKKTNNGSPKKTESPKGKRVRVYPNMRATSTRTAQYRVHALYRTVVWLT